MPTFKHIFFVWLQLSWSHGLIILDSTSVYTSSDFPMINNWLGLSGTTQSEGLSGYIQWMCWIHAEKMVQNQKLYYFTYLFLKMLHLTQKMKHKAIIYQKHFFRWPSTCTQRDFHEGMFMHTELWKFVYIQNPEVDPRIIFIHKYAHILNYTRKTIYKVA